MNYQTRLFSSALALALLTACGGKTVIVSADRVDVHSYGNPQQVKVQHVDLDLNVDFERRVLAGYALLKVQRTDSSAPLIVDTRDLKIAKVESADTDKGPYVAAKFTVGAVDKILGAPLTIEIPSDHTLVKITYETSPGAKALQWLTPEQTAGKKHPYLFTQSQAINARSWIPLQDSPGVRVTYRARIRTPKDLIALMSARRDFRLAKRDEPPTGDYTFRSPYAIPSYLIALAVGNLDSRDVSTRSSVWAEPEGVEKAAKEFEDTERMILAAEAVYGPYEWLRYDILVLPPSFPFGGMENPTLTFATPTVIAGDKSLVSLVAHELAHSWSGNLVTNATWADFWLNEGFTTYVERRIIERVYGPERARMEAVLGREALEEAIKTLPENDQILHQALKGRDPDDGVTDVAYEKGALFLTHIEQVVGRGNFDALLFTWFKEHAFQSATTKQFEVFLNERLLSRDPKFAGQVPVREWLYEPGIPPSAPKLTSDAFVAVDEVAAAWAKGDAPQTKVKTAGWSTQQWLRLLTKLPETLPATRLASLDRTFGFTKSGNAEITTEWLKTAIRNEYHPADKRAEEYMIAVGRRKLVRPLYAELLKTDAGKQRAAAIYAKARPGYHPILTTTVDDMFAKAGVK
jgi:leukotriene-A4 hydrolase